MHNFDSGNYIIAGEDCLEALNIFRDRIAHVHLKDRVTEVDFACPAIGSGCIPEAEVIHALLSCRPCMRGNIPLRRNQLYK